MIMNFYFPYTFNIMAVLAFCQYVFRLFIMILNFYFLYAFNIMAVLAFCQYAFRQLLSNLGFFGFLRTFVKIMSGIFKQ